MKKLHADLLARRDELGRRLAEAEARLTTKLDAAEATFKATMESLGKEIHPEVAIYNEILSECRELAEEARDEVQGYFDDKAESWQSGKTGQRYEAWIGDLDGIRFDDVEIEVPEDPDWLDVDFEASDTLDEFPDALPD